MSAEAIIALVALAGSFVASQAALIWFASSKYYDLKIFLKTMHVENINKFQSFERRIISLEQHRHGRR